VDVIIREVNLLQLSSTLAFDLLPRLITFIKANRRWRLLATTRFLQCYLNVISVYGWWWLAIMS